MSIYYVKQDNTIWGCGEIGCCGEYVEEIDELFHLCDCDVEFSEEHLRFCVAGGPILEWRKATPLEAKAFNNGVNEGYDDGWQDGAAYEKEKHG